MMYIWGHNLKREFLAQAWAVAMASLDLKGCFLYIDQGRDHDSVDLLHTQCVCLVHIIPPGVLAARSVEGFSVEYISTANANS